MTNASVKPALIRIEKKLQEIDEVMNELSTKTKNEVDANPSSTIEKSDCECKNVGKEQEPQQEKEEKSGDSKNG